MDLEDIGNLTQYQSRHNFLTAPAPLSTFSTCMANSIWEQQHSERLFATVLCAVYTMWSALNWELQASAGHKISQQRSCIQKAMRKGWYQRKAMVLNNSTICSRNWHMNWPSSCFSLIYHLWLLQLITLLGSRRRHTFLSLPLLFSKHF